MQAQDAVCLIHGEAHGADPDTWLEVTKSQGTVSVHAYGYKNYVYNANHFPNKNIHFEPESVFEFDASVFKPREFLYREVEQATKKEILAFSLKSMFYTCHRAWLNNDSERFDTAFNQLCGYVPWFKELKTINDGVHTREGRPEWASYHLGLALHQSNIFNNHTDENFVAQKLSTFVQKIFTTLNLQSGLAYLFTTRTVDVPLLYALQDPKSQKTTGYLLKILNEPEMDEVRPSYTHSWLDKEGALLFVMQDGSNNTFRGKHRCLASNVPVKPAPGLNPLPYHNLVKARPVLQTSEQQLELIDRWATSERASLFHAAWVSGSRDWYSSSMATWAIKAWSNAHPKDSQILDMLLVPLHDSSDPRADIDNAPLTGQWRDAIADMVRAKQTLESYPVGSLDLDSQ